LLLQIDGRGNTKKSHLIQLLSYKFTKIAFIYNLPTPIIRTTHINITAYNINSYTFYSLP
ncbi:hypothetical protein GE21DRAFT_1218825, partial [Neurospora crassa]